MQYVIVRDSDKKVLGVYKEEPDPVDGCTIYNEEYTGSAHWHLGEVEVFRDGVSDYRDVDHSEE